MHHGRIWLRGALNAEDLVAIETNAQHTDRPGARFDDPEALMRLFGPQTSLGCAISTILPGAKPTRAVGFDKSADQNWGVGWHQDRVIAVQERHDVPGFEKWSVKSGVSYCEPPQSVPKKMLFVRVHLDDVKVDNGPMEIAVGSHTDGIQLQADL